MSSEVWDYASTLSQVGDPDSREVRGIAQRFEENPLLQDIFGRINSLHELQRERAAVNAKKRKKKSTGKGKGKVKA